MSSQGDANTKVVHTHNLCQASILEGKETSRIGAGCTELVLNKNGQQDGAWTGVFLL